VQDDAEEIREVANDFIENILAPSRDSEVCFSYLEFLFYSYFLEANSKRPAVVTIIQVLFKSIWQASCLSRISFLVVEL
jgi:hypothetical protein